MIRCDDGTNYAITDVSRYDKNYFADGPLGPLPKATCDWSRFDQPELPKAEVRRFNDPDGDYIFIRNLYETRRMLYSLYNAMGEDEWIMQSGSPRMRGVWSNYAMIEVIDYTIVGGIKMADITKFDSTNGGPELIEPHDNLIKISVKV